jgi:hypothetical protein
MVGVHLWIDLQIVGAGNALYVSNADEERIGVDHFR